jgi:hypothetical protein
MGTDWVRIFDLGLARKLVAMDRASLARWLEEHLVPIQEKACRRAEQWARSLAASIPPSGHAESHELRARTCERYAKEWEEARDRVRAGSGTELPARERDDLVERAVVEGEEPLYLDSWGCLGIGFEASDADGALPSDAILPTKVLGDPRPLLFEILGRPQDAPPRQAAPEFVLLLPAHLDRMIRSLREHRHELSVMTEEDLLRLADFRDRCARNTNLRVAYHPDY